MKLLQKVNKAVKSAAITEDAAGGAMGGGDVCAVAMPLFTALVGRSIPDPNEKPKVIKYGKKTKNGKRDLKLKETFYHLAENDPTISKQSVDTTDALAKLKALETKEKQDVRDTVTFGLEDGDGQIVRVTIKNEQGADFEKALQALMTDADEEDDLPEIAELLFKLKDQFDIIDVEWPEIAEDEEEQQNLEGNQQDPNALGDEGGELDLGGEDTGAPTGDEGQVKDLLAQVIDMMKADAEARKADAKAREAEAKNREAEAAVAQAMAHVKQEEQVLDMESHNKARKEESKEAKRLAQLARWKHDMNTDEDSETDLQPAFGGQEEEEILRRPVSAPAQRPQKTVPIRGRVHPHDIATYILNRIQ